MSAYVGEIERVRNPEKEYTVKAALLCKIHQLMTWPDVPKHKNKKRINICVIGENPFSEKAQEVFKVFSNENFEYRFMVSKKLKRHYCHIVFIAENKADEIDDILRKLGSTPTLTVSEVAGFAKSGGDMEWFLFANRVIRTLINQRSALEKGFIYSPEVYNENIIRFVHKSH